MIEVAGIVKSLTRLQRDFLIDVAPIFDNENPAVNANLILAGLVSFRRKWWLFGPRIIGLTPLGLAVRSALAKEEKP